MGKEAYAGVTNVMGSIEGMPDEYILDTEKEYYEANETITAKYTAPSNDDIKIANTKNTCFYKFMSHYFSALEGKNASVDRNECFNTNQFPDLVNLTNCGYAQLTLNTKEGKPLNLNTCYFIPDNHMPDSTKNYFKYLFMDYLFYQAITFDPEAGPSAGNTTTAPPELKYELTVEDKYGKKYKYNETSYSPEVIEEGMQGDKIYGTNDNANHLKTTFINYILLLFMISLILI